MKRPRLSFCIGMGLLALVGAQAQQEAELPFYEGQLAGVQLGWQARTITGLWDFDRVTPEISARLRAVYRMPDHIIMRMGTRPPIFQGSGSGPPGTYNFLLGTYGRGNSAGGAGGGGEGGGGPGAEPGLAPGQAQGPTQAQIDDKVERFLAQAQGVEPAPPPAEPGMPPGGPGLAPPGEGGFQEQAMEQLRQHEYFTNIPADGYELQYLALLAQVAEIELELAALGAQPRPASAAEADARREHVLALEQRRNELLNEAYQIGQFSETLRLRQGAQAWLGAFRPAVHVFHVGRPERDLVFCYRMSADTWLSLTINFYTWQVNGITVANTRGTWGGARTSTAPDGTRGVMLGDNLQHVFNRYGWPDGWESFYGRYLLLHYYDSNNVGFMLDHPSPKVWRVVRMIIEPRPNAQERQLAGVQLGINAQELLTIRNYRTGELVYGEPDAVERPNHRISFVTSAVEPNNWPPGVPLDASIFGASSFGGSQGTGGPEGGPGEPGAPGEAGLEGTGPQGQQAAGVMGGRGVGGGYNLGGGTAVPGIGGAITKLPDGARPGAATDRYGRPAAMAQAPVDEGVPGDAGGLGEAGGVESAGSTGSYLIAKYPMPFAYTADGMNVESLCGSDTAGAAAGPGGGEIDAGPGAGEGAGGPAAGGGGAAGGGAGSVTRDSLAEYLNRLYGDDTNQTGFNIAYGMRSGTACAIDLALPETQFRWDYAFPQAPKIDRFGRISQLPDTRAEFGVDSDGLTTQIGVMGVKWGGARTKRGIGLGSELRDVLIRYGPPLLFDQFIDDVNEQSPNVQFVSYARDELGRPRGNINMVLQDQAVTAIQILQLGVR